MRHPFAPRFLPPRVEVWRSAVRRGRARPIATKAVRPAWRRQLLAAVIPVAAALALPAWAQSSEPAADTEASQSLDVARRAAIRSNQQEQQAIHQLLQGSGVCETQLQNYCAQPGTACSTQLLNTCRAIAAQKSQCQTVARQYCRQQRLPDCDGMIEQQCPGKSWHTLDAVLARHPNLTVTQQARLRQLAAQLDSGDASALSRITAQLMELLSGR